MFGLINSMIGSLFDTKSIFNQELTEIFRSNEKLVYVFMEGIKYRLEIINEFFES